ncbi:unnamed protein product [Leptidea sinapis]|uniref:Retrotransposon gag domain-containing protein n=1 Tax=Leptidea sinapis TaxID=189913 RepID=A0A5E4QYR9_9NEOP|nr:unnamed protein product [Leptidea sinapis]
MIRNKLSGKAVEPLSESPGAMTWPQIKDILQKKIGESKFTEFNSPKTEIQLVQELMSITKEGPLEVFSEKIKTITSALIAIEPQKRIFYEQMSLETFLDKLNPLTAMAIKLKHAANLDQAVTYAKQEEVKLRARRAKQLKTNAIKPQIKPRLQNTGT